MKPFISSELRFIYLLFLRIRLEVIRILKNFIKIFLYFIFSTSTRKKILKNLKITKLYFFYKKAYLTQRVIFLYEKKKRKLKKKTNLNVVFFLLHEPAWQYALIYNLMSKSKRFNPTIVVIPYIFLKEEMIDDMANTYDSLKRKGYNTINSYDNREKKFKNIKRLLHPDIIFFPNPHSITRKEYLIDYWSSKALTYYIPYSSGVSNLYNMQYNSTFHNTLWRFFCQTEIHKKISAKYALNKGANVKAMGYPKWDIFFEKDYIPKDCWKIKNKNLKRIIWSPHHTIEKYSDAEIQGLIEKTISYSCFLEYHQVILDIAKRYSNEIQIAFKPHPLLKKKLYKHVDWGRENTDKYYEKWQNLPNGQLEESTYQDLFLSSDAMINCSGSFVAEYLFVNKPCLFLLSNEYVMQQFNEFGNFSFGFVVQSRK